ncbi:3-hydroxy-D-aspartate aldolase BhcC [Paracoccus denitrificans]|jgi:3-hydroxy-D-aspartate aldolase|uniref:3-hydroxy-D-aspartate aldolase n=1 Tax=Paracoccus denitrificans (strain Pd 1222) TaxID=318586 RepID=BHCC_PARDP|nr:3-hydroxy-D-aspartate aldolase BhcC [Paracoccus denitrificans]A1B8Z1.1 RecName: Full=3-hydroxy-D-aspartate aldolase; AltName: Full=beta-hydroxyaspartate aldolase [Paracoccus denitrificans PD1222]6QKB_A Chain A, D-3-hydroxyaspartate aldolase [Paracoccus denitrificans]6QKB_B Chain B, D-3-hydroxyaspartate aldolase [Paracoccus denitrificans]ABL71985.1 D-3-hydroxyaspartate aldolase [Paracoccus denitrificans PD1222]MBB4626111.1 3-hydroxy-D-aspartate aldolase [Paracoccus denitrificans]MCU7426730.
MNAKTDFSGYEVGYDIPALPGMDESEIQTPCLILDLDALERNIRKMGDYAKAHGMRHRSHGKMHKSVDVQKLQESLGGSVGVCCQKVSEAEAFARGGIKDVLVTNEVREPAKIDRLARLPKTGATVTVCVDDVQNIADLSAAAQKHGTELGIFVEIDCGAGRCGVTTKEAVVEIAKAAAAAPNLTFKGIQAYQGAMQHMDSFEDRKAKLDAAIAQVKEAVDALEAEGLAPEFVSGGGTGSYYFESNSGIYNELQCGSYAFMDADYGRIHDAEGKRIDQGEWENALFILTSVMSHAKPHLAVVDAGLKAQSVDSGLPFVYGRDDVKYIKCSDEHGVVEDKDGVLKVNDKLRLVPGHCDPTCNVHDWYVGVRNGKVETVWPVSARGKGY